MPAATPHRRRRLNPGETALARRVFGSLLDVERVRLVRRSHGRFAFVIGRTIHLPPSAPEDFADASPNQQGWLVHELTHVWQFQTQPWRTLASWLGVALSGGYGPGQPGYAYRLPLRRWADGNLEQQARIVEHAFLLSVGASCSRIPAGATPAHYRGATPFSSQALDPMDNCPDPADL